MHTPFTADRVDGNDVGVVQLSRGLRLVVKANDLLLVEDRREREHLQSDRPPHRSLFRFVNDSHPTTPQLAQDAKVSEFAVGQGGALRRVHIGSRLPKQFESLEVKVQGFFELRMLGDQFARIHLPPTFHVG